MNQLIIKNRELFGLNLGLIGALAVALCVTLLISWWAFLFLVPAPFILMTTTGVEFDFDRQAVRTYRRFFGWSSGKWIDLRNYSNVVLLSKRGYRLVSRRPLSTAEYKTYEDYFELNLMDESHLRRRYVHVSDNLQEMEELCERITTGSCLTRADFNPQTGRRRSLFRRR